MKSRIKYLFAAILLIWNLIPVYWVLNLSFQYRFQIYSNPASLFPPTPNLSNYLRAFGFFAHDPYKLLNPSGYAPSFIQGIINSLIVSLPVTVLTLALAIPAGYVFGRLRFRRKGLLFFVILTSRTLPPIAVVIPYYQFFLTLHLLGTQLGLIIIYVVISVPLITWVMTGFFATMPPDVENQARVDGCSRFQALVRVLIPMILPGIAATAILTFLDSWNEFIFALILTGTSAAQTLPPAIAAPLFGFGGDIEVMTAISSFSLIPAIVAALILQKFITNLRLVSPVILAAGEAR
jgi:multiple sugar transport system permease protein